VRRAKARIEKALRDNGMQVGHIWKGYDISSGHQYGWYQSGVGQTWYLGRSADEAVDTIASQAEAATYL